MKKNIFIHTVGFLFIFSFSFSQNEVLKIEQQVKQQVLDSLSNQLLRNYVFKEEAVKMCSFLKEKWKLNAYDSISEPHLFAKTLTNDVKSVFKDEHFHVDYDTVMAYEVSGEIEDIPAFVEAKLKQEKEKNFGYKKIEVLANNVGYMELSYFARLNDYSKTIANNSFNQLSKCKALIIDLRYGAGGSPEMANYILSHFFAKKTHVNDIYLRKENTTIKYYSTPDASFAKFYNMPVYILCSHTTFSAAEALTYQLQSFKRALIVGEKTRGGAHVVSFQPLGNGFVADIPFGRAISPVTKTNWEGVGIMPDIACEAKDALEVALKKIETKKPAPKETVNKQKKK